MIIVICYFLNGLRGGRGRPHSKRRKNPLQKSVLGAFLQGMHTIEGMWHDASDAVKCAFKRCLSGDPVCVCVCKYRAIVLMFN